MFIRPVFEFLGIALVAASILLMVFFHSPVMLLMGVALLVMGGVMIYRHYVEMGNQPDVLDFMNDPEGI